ncbi:hypothetical protein M405DRAFT_217447 [Rhizopogon salebrosus TDB-379]|nr:hypothetical protein M405DRAFT_217447 [Rhizopogon salebrosus TDB-379]
MGLVLMPLCCLLKAEYDRSALSAPGLRKEERMKSTVSNFEQREVRWSICTTTSSHLTNCDRPPMHQCQMLYQI